jgi:hypothetical protein
LSWSQQKVVEVGKDEDEARLGWTNLGKYSSPRIDGNLMERPHGEGKVMGKMRSTFLAKE